MPKRLSKEETTATDTYAKFIAEPFETGYGHTIGNSIRRVLLSSLEGAAITSVKIDGAMHEFTTVDGAVEDVTDIVLNIKQVAIRMAGDTAKRVYLNATGPGPVTAGQIAVSGDMEVMNKDLVICTLDDGAKLSMELIIDTGKGYVPASENRPEDAPIGLIPVDAIYSPVRRVAYRVEPTRVGQRTDYDKLILSVETDGTLAPEDAVGVAARIIQEQLQILINFDEPRPELAADLRDDLRRHDDSGALVGTYAHGRLTEGAINLRQGPLHALPVAQPRLVLNQRQQAGRVSGEPHAHARVPKHAHTRQGVARGLGFVLSAADLSDQLAHGPPMPSSVVNGACQQALQ